MRPCEITKWVVVLVAASACWVQGVRAEQEQVLLKLLGEELAYSSKELAMADGTKPYYISYTITDKTSVSMRARLGALMSDEVTRGRQLGVDVRVGDYSLDSTHKIRGGGFGFDRSDFFGGATQISIEDDPEAIKHAIWLATDRTFKSAVKKYQRVQTNLKTMVEEEDKSDDFSKEEAVVYSEPAVSLDIDRKAWADRLRGVAKIARGYPLIYSSSVSLNASAENRYMVTTEGTRLQTGRKLLRVVVSHP